MRDTTSTLQRRIEQLQAELAELRAHVLREPETIARVARQVVRAQAESKLGFHRSTAELRRAAETALVVASAIEGFAASIRRPAPRGRAGGLARARNAWRYLDGTFMPEAEKAEAYSEEYERHAAGGRARARTAVRAADGRFARVAYVGEDQS